MASDPSKPLLRLVPEPARDRPVGKPRSVPSPDRFPRERQTERFGPVFSRLADVLDRDVSGLELRADPAALAPERLLVFEVRGQISGFAAAVAKVSGLEIVDEEELPSDDDDAPVMYLLVSDARALEELLSRWRRYLRGAPQRGEAVWRDVFDRLRDLRPWGPTDRVQAGAAAALADEISVLDDSAMVRLEVELVFRAAERAAAQAEGEVTAVVRQAGGGVTSVVRIPEIGYHALLIDLPASEVRPIAERRPSGIAALDAVMYVQPQSVADTSELAEPGDGAARPAEIPLGEPILAMLDGVPVAAHPALARHVVVHDIFGCEPQTQVRDRSHGTAMASLVVHGDLNRSEDQLPRKIHLVPVLGASGLFTRDRLIVDLVYTAVSAMRDGPEPFGPSVLVVNLSLGNRRRPFHGQMSPWARLLDRLAYRFGLLFIVSAGNHHREVAISGFSSRSQFEDAGSRERAEATIRALGAVAGERRLISPAEHVNGLTVGGANQDSIPETARPTASIHVDPFGDLLTSNPSSAMGPGFANSVKPDVLLPGGRERLTFVRDTPSLEYRPAGASRASGLKVAAPPTDGNEASLAFTSGTSAAAALAARTAHRIHDALELAYGSSFVGLPAFQRAVLLKALLAHPASWPAATDALIRAVLGPADSRQSVRQKDNVRRFLGNGVVDADDAVACAADRATFWATGHLPPDQVADISVPVPQCIGGRAQPHFVAATLAWFTPVAVGRRAYRAVRMNLSEPESLKTLGVSADREQPDVRQTRRGTLIQRRWSGSRAPAASAADTLQLTVQREPDSGTRIDEPVPFALAVSIAMPGVIEVYEQVRQRLGIQLQNL